MDVNAALKFGSIYSQFMDISVTGLHFADLIVYHKPFPPTEPAKSTSTCLYIFHWQMFPLSLSMPFISPHTFSLFLSPSVLRQLKACAPRGLWEGGTKNCHTEPKRLFKNQWIELIPYRKREIVMPVQIFSVLFFLCPHHAHYPIWARD